MPLTTDQVQSVFRIVKQAIELGLNGVESTENFEAIADNFGLTEKQASFVTLHTHGELRGCIGTLEAYRPLAEDIFANAYSAAFRDPRFPELESSELSDLDVEVSILSTPEYISGCLSKNDLLDTLEPYVDGLVISDGVNKATFLPSVWEQMPDKEMFVNHLMRKAGIGYWSDKIRCQRYKVVSYGREWKRIA